jgi:hypothetical protein
LQDEKQLAQPWPFAQPPAGQPGIAVACGGDGMGAWAVAVHVLNHSQPPTASTAQSFRMLPAFPPATVICFLLEKSAFGGQNANEVGKNQKRQTG